MIELPTLPPPVPRPCSACPWRRASAPGWLGPLSPQEWVSLAHGDQPVACHMTIPPGLGRAASWDDPTVRQCAGAATFRANVCKSPVNPTDAANAAEQEKVDVFASDTEFVDHHEPTYRRLYEPARRRAYGPRP